MCMGKASSVGKDNLEKVINLVSAAFKYPEGELISRDFPLFFSEANADHLFVIYDDSETGKDLASHAGTFQSVLKTEEDELKVGGIGGVATDERFQGKGFGKEVIESCLEDLRANGCALAFLWSGEHEFFRKFGFELVGAQWSIDVPVGSGSKIDQVVEALYGPEGVAKFNQIEVLEGNRHIYKDGFDLYNGHSLRLNRSKEEFKTLVSSEGCQVMAAKYKGKTIAYAINGKGIDLPNHIHEWAGEELGLMAILKTLTGITTDPLTVLAPQFTPQESPWIYSLEQAGFSCTLGYMAMVKIMDFEKIHALINQRASRLAMDPSLIRFEHTGEDSYTVGWATDADIELTESELLQFVFGPKPPSEQVPLSEDGAAAFDSLLPIRLWWWGMDSV